MTLAVRAAREYLAALLTDVVASTWEKRGEIVNVRVPESPIFNDPGPLDLSW